MARGLDAGADDFLIKPVSSDELRARIAAGDRVLEMQRELSEKNRLIEKALDELKVAHDAIDKDLIQARKIQESLVPELTREFGSSRVSLLLKPCGHIGGDLVGMFSPGVKSAGFLQHRCVRARYYFSYDDRTLRKLPFQSLLRTKRCDGKALQPLLCAPATRGSGIDPELAIGRRCRVSKNTLRWPTGS